jgi:hypothetical protein
MVTFGRKAVIEHIHRKSIESDQWSIEFWTGRFTGNCEEAGADLCE